MIAPSFRALCFALALLAGPAAVGAIVSRSTVQGPVIRFETAQFAVSRATTPPTVGWREAKAGLTLSRNDVSPRGPAPTTLWVRMIFDRAALGAEPLAIYTADNRNRTALFLNGVEIHRDYAASADPLVTTYEPLLVPIPSGLLRPGRNELVAAITSRGDLGAGVFEIGPQRVMNTRWGWMNLWRIDVPRKVNFAMLTLCYGSFVYWGFNRRETRFALLGVSGFLWCISNTGFLFESSAMGEVVLSEGPTLFLVLAAAVTLLFAADFVDLPNRRWLAVPILACGAILAGLYALAPEHWIADGIAQGLAVMLLVLAATASALMWRRSREGEALGLSLLLLLISVGLAHDLGRAWYVHAWNGLGLFTRPYAGFLMTIALLFSFGRRSTAAFARLQRANVDLQERVAQARLEVAVSEARRRALEIASAMEAERERLLREMHDGIGSNLVTALAVAEQQNHPPNVVRTLRRALSDLKITIDSLEPVEGDLVALLANLRHRMERDLRDAGLACRWRVEACRPLSWLDATNALHVLRIFQEAIGNALSHAGAATLEIGCHEAMAEGMAGIEAYVVDDGRGFDAASTGVGKGVANMQSRARALHGRFSFSSSDAGTRVTLWLPYDRP